MQHSPASDLPSLSSSNPFNGDLASQKAQDTVTPTTNGRSAKSVLGHSAKAKSQKAAATARLEIRSKLREDWDWPQTEKVQPQTTLNLPESDTAWHERGSDSSLSTVADPYRYDSPDEVAEPVHLKRQKRRHQVNEEASWNEGLKTWLERRDAWTGAQKRAPQERTATTANPTEPSTPTTTSSSSSPSSPSVAQDALSPPPTADTQSNNSSGSDLLSAQTSITTVSSSPPTSFSSITPTQPSEASPSPVILIPLAPPLLPTNQIRTSITPAAYPSIYSKIIVQGLTPTIPINLSDVVAAMVQGRQKDGEWPSPNTGVAPGEPDRELAKLRRNGDEGEGRGPGVGMGGKEVGDELLGVKDGGKRVVRRGIGKVRKTFGGIVGGGTEKTNENAEGGEGPIMEVGGDAQEAQPAEQQQQQPSPKKERECPGKEGIGKVKKALGLRSSGSVGDAVEPAESLEKEIVAEPERSPPPQEKEREWAGKEGIVKVKKVFGLGSGSSSSTVSPAIEQAELAEADPVAEGDQPTPANEREWVGKEGLIRMKKTIGGLVGNVHGSTYSNSTTVDGNEQAEVAPENDAIIAASSSSSASQEKEAEKQRILGKPGILKMKNALLGLGASVHGGSSGSGAGEPRDETTIEHEAEGEQQEHLDEPVPQVQPKMRQSEDQHQENHAAQRQEQPEEQVLQQEQYQFPAPDTPVEAAPAGH